MSLFDKIRVFFAPAKRGPEPGSMEIAVRCSRCGEIIRARIDLNHELSAEYGEGGRETAYLCRKVLLGKKGCFAPIEIRLRFDAKRNPTEREITGGKFINGAADP